MKRFWLVLLSLGLVLAFSASAMAVDVQFSGSFYAAGIYLDKTNFIKADGTAGNNPSTAFFYQRLRVQTDFIVSPGLKFVTRFDALERIWGGNRSTPGTTQDTLGIGTRAENQNIAFDLAYVEYASPIGLFKVGYQIDNSWATDFGNNSTGYTSGQINYMLPIGPFYLGAIYYKEGSLSKSSVTPSTVVDNDSDKYVLYGIYNVNKDINFGLLYSGSRVATYKPAYSVYGGAMILVNTLQPYVRAKIGPVYVEAEAWYMWGRYPAYEDGALGHDVKLENIMGYVKAVVDLGPVYFGGTAAYISGDNPGTTDKLEGGVATGGLDWNPCLIMFNNDLTYWAGALPGYNGTTNASPMSNAWFGQGKVGVRPIPPLDINASLSYAQADQKPTGVLNNSYGWEIDVTGTYKITNNLAYMLGVGYLFTGDYYKGTSNDNAVRDNYMLINKLTLTF
jgi:hypothetical protein